MMESNNKAKEEIIELYKNLGWKSFFTKIRFWDAPLVEAEKYIPKKGKFVDLGCGDGIFTNYLAVSSPKRKIEGYDFDSERLKIADRKLKNVSYTKADIRNLDFPFCDSFIIFQVLHHLASFEEQEEIIKRCRKKLKKGGFLFVLEIDIRPSLGYVVGWFTDHFLVPLVFEKRLYSKIFFRKRQEWKRLFEKNGFDCKIIELGKNKPVANILLKCEAK